MRTAVFGMLTALCLGAVLLFCLPDNKTTLSKSVTTVTVKNGGGAGKDLNVPARPQRVVFLTASSMELWLGAGGKDTVVGRPQATMLPQEVLDMLPDKAVDLGKPNVMSLEKVLSLKPDLVVGAGMVSSQQQMEEPLSAVGIPFLVIPKLSIEDTFKELTAFGQLTGQPEKAAAEIQRMRGNIEQEAQRRAGRPPKKVLLVWGSSEGFSIALPDSLPGDMLRLAGGENIAPQMSGGVKLIPFSMEFAVQANPDIVLFITHGDRKKVKLQMERTLAENSAWQTIKAIREERMEVLPPELFAVNPGLRSDQAVVYLSKLLYPEER